MAGSPASATPRFGQADLSNCEREPIHLAGSIQPHGALLVVSEADRTIVQASANAASFLNLPDVLGRGLGELPGNLAQRIAPLLELPLDRLPIAVRCEVGAPAMVVDVLAHRSPSGVLVIELERAGPAVDLSHAVAAALETVLGCASLRTLADEAARVVQELSGYDRVMVYRFDEAGHGEVFAERRRADLEPFLGNRYPASDIPQIARRLYEINRIRMLVDVASVPVPLCPRLLPHTGDDLDMSLCFLRSLSPIHIQYLKNMGVAATLVASLMVGGRLWGLIACHHYAPRCIHYELRAVCELLSETVATRIAALESFARAQSELTVRRLEQRMIQAISRDGDWRSALFDSAGPLLHPVGATGAALLYEGQTLTVGEVPSTAQLRELGAWLDSRPRSPVLATNALASEAPGLAALTPVAAGVMAAPVSAAPGEYLIWFRPERVRTVTWGGNPFKPALVGDDPAELSPRRSFAQWHQVVEGTANPWTPADLSSAKMIGETVTDVVLQFRAVRLLITQSQLELVRRQVRRAEQPVLVADPEGRVLLANRAFEELVGGQAKLRWIDDLPSLFAAPEATSRVLTEVFEQRRPWRGELSLGLAGDGRAVMLRADPVFSAPDHVLGYVLLLTDLAPRRAAEAARRSFQEEVVARRRLAGVPLATQDDLVFRDLLGSVVGNAQLAALEIADGVELAAVPEMLESVRASVARAAELLERLVWHAAASDPGSGRQD